MNIIDVGLKPKYPLTARTTTENIIIHHAATSSVTVESIDAYHKSKDGGNMNMIGYHYLVRKSGDVYVGRPEWATGGHTIDYNKNSIGICFEGNFEKEVMTDKQFRAGVEFISFLLSEYPKFLFIIQHKDVNATACPGRNFPFDEMASQALGPFVEYPQTNPDTPSDWAKTETEWAVKSGLFQGDNDDGTGLRWHDNITREELAVVLYRYHTGTAINRALGY